MSRLFQPQRLDDYPPQERRRLVVIGLVFTTASAFMVFVGVATGVAGVAPLIVGGAGVLFFGAGTVYFISELLRLRRR